MAIEDIIQFFSGIPPFQFLNEKELRTIAENVSMEFYPRGTVILRQNDPASDALRIIKKGGVQISLRNEDGQETIIDHRGEGDTFGLLSLMGRDDRQKTSVIAIEDTICYLMKKEQVLPVIETNPALTEYFLQFHFTKYIDKTSRELRSKSLFSGSGDHLLLTTPVSEIAARDVVTVAQDASIREAAQVMSRNRISSLIIVDDNGLPVGIITDRDLREKVVARSKDVTDMVRDIMTLPMIRVDARDFCYEAVLKMIKHNVHHVLVIREGRLYGVLTNHDLMMLQGTSPLAFSKDLEGQVSIEGIASVSRKIDRMAGVLLKEGAKAGNIAKIITELNDRLVRRVLEIAEKKFGKPPVPYCWAVLGSEGRKEQIFRTDQDNALIHADADAAVAEDTRRYFSTFSAFVRDSLVRCGFPACPADHMASNPRWCQPLSVWKQYYTTWVMTPNPEAVVRSLVFFDLRPLHGEELLAMELRAHMTALLTGQEQFLTQMASAVLANRPPLGFFKTFIVEKNGEHKDELNLKFRGIGPLVDIVRLLALEAGVAATSTLERIEALKGRNPAVDASGDELAQAFEFLMLLRMHHQVEQSGRGGQPGNFINPSRLSNLEKRMLKESFHAISGLQETVAERYRINMAGV